jgi:hypothetical protein
MIIKWVYKKVKGEEKFLTFFLYFFLTKLVHFENSVHCYSLLHGRDIVIQP